MFKEEKRIIRLQQLHDLIIKFHSTEASPSQKRLKSNLLKLTNSTNWNDVCHKLKYVGQVELKGSIAPSLSSERDLTCPILFQNLFDNTDVYLSTSTQYYVKPLGSDNSKLEHNHHGNTTKKGNKLGNWGIFNKFLNIIMSIKFNEITIEMIKEVQFIKLVLPKLNVGEYVSKANGNIITGDRNKIENKIELILSKYYINKCHKCIDEFVCKNPIQQYCLDCIII